MRFLLLLGSVLLGACSATKLVYNKLDWFAAWQVGKYVELDGPVETAFTRGFEALWHWHRGTQLGLYARDLRELADAAARPLSPAQVEDFMQRANVHAERLLDEALPGAVTVFRSMSDAQIEQMLERIAEKRVEELEEDAALTDADRRERAVERLHKQLKRWLGAITREQQQHVQDWVAARRFDPALWQRYSEEWAGAFAARVADRAQPDFAARLRQLMLDPPLPSAAAVSALQLQNQAAAIALLAQLSATLSDKQRAHFQHRLRELARDLDTLAAQAQPPR